MKLVIIDNSPDSQASVLGRVQEALRQADIKRLEVEEADSLALEGLNWETTLGCLIGPGCYSELDEVVSRVRAMYPTGPLAVILDSDFYASEGVGVKKRLGVQVIALGDLQQIASFLIDCDSQSGAASGGHKSRGVIGVTQFKGGVGTTTLTAAISSCWARHGLSVAAIDLDDVNPQLTQWARVGVDKKTIASELLRAGEVPVSRVNELVHPVEGFEGRFVVVGQPETYNEGFHFKANVLEGIPSASEYVHSLIEALKAEFDIVVIDLARSWGVSTFTCLPLCQHVLLVTDDDGMSVRRTLDGIARLKAESGDSEEFELSRWSLVLNGYTGRLISPKEIAMEIQEMELFPPDSSLWTVPFSDGGRQWGAPGQSFYETAEQQARDEIRKICHSMVPFKFEKDPTLSEKLLKKWQGVVGAS